MLSCFSVYTYTRLCLQDMVQWFPINLTFLFKFHVGGLDYRFTLWLTKFKVVTKCIDVLVVYLVWWTKYFWKIHILLTSFKYLHIVLNINQRWSSLLVIVCFDAKGGHVDLHIFRVPHKTLITLQMRLGIHLSCIKSSFGHSSWFYHIFLLILRSILLNFFNFSLICGI